MNEYIELVILVGVDGERFLGYAPAFTHLKDGDEVMVEGLAGDVFKVLESCLTVIGDEHYKFIVEAFQGDPVRITAKLNYEFFKYEPEINEEVQG